MDDRWAIIAFVTDPAHLFPVSCPDGLYLHIQLMQSYLIYMDGVLPLHSFLI